MQHWPFVVNLRREEDFNPEEPPCYYLVQAVKKNKEYTMKRALAIMALVASTTPSGAQDWTGGYVGLTVGQGSGEVEVPAISATDTLDSDTVYGLFAGYNLQRNSIVYGAELAYQSGDINSEAFAQGIDQLVDLKGRVGYAAGSGLVYGVLGYSANRAFVSTGDTSDGDGFSLGIGYDYQINDAFTVGAEYLNRQMKNDATGTIRELEPDISTFSLRAGMRF
jgi:outer membrane immunogenic protein